MFYLKRDKPHDHDFSGKIIYKTHFQIILQCNAFSTINAWLLIFEKKDKKLHFYVSRNFFPFENGNARHTTNGVMFEPIATPPLFPIFEAKNHFINFLTNFPDFKVKRVLHSKIVLRLGDFWCVTDTPIVKTSSPSWDSNLFIKLLQ